MSPLNSILAATDLSAPARHAAERAARLAHEHQASLTLMHVMAAGALQELRSWLGAESDVATRLKAESAARLEQLAGELRRARHATVHAVCRPGQVLDEIGREADACHADLLVLGARGEGFLRRMAMGATSERLLRRTTRPMLVVRQAPHDRYRRVLVATDFSPWSVGALRAARRIAPQARLMLFHAWQVPFADKLTFAGVDAATIAHYRLQARQDATLAVCTLAQTAGLKPSEWEPVVVEGEASQRLAEQEQERDADLVVMGKHGRSATEDLLLGSVTKHLLAEGAADVLVSTQQSD